MSERVASSGYRIAASDPSQYSRDNGTLSLALMFKKRRLALSHAHAESGEAVAAAAAAELVEEAHDEPRAAHPEGVAERDRAAVHVHLLRVETELADHDEALGGERLVQLDEIEVGDGDPCPSEKLAHGRDRPDAHHSRIDPGDRAADEGAERLDAQFSRLLLGRDHESGGAVVDPARVPRGDRPALTERRPKRRQLLRARL